MFLKNWLSKFLFSSLCERCHQPLGAQKVFCDPCQAELYYHLSKSNIIEQGEGYIELLLTEDPSFFDILFRLYQNPRYPFLNTGIASLILLKISNLKELSWPNFLVSTSFLKNGSSNHQFFKSLAKLMNIPLISFKDFQSNKLKGSTYLILTYADQEGINKESFKEGYLIHCRYLGKSLSNNH